MDGNSNRQGWLKVGLTFAGLLVGAMVVGSSIAGETELSLAVFLSLFRFDRHGILISFVLMWGILVWFANRQMQQQVELAKDYVQQAASWVEHIEARAQGLRSNNYNKAMEQLADTNPQLQVVGVYALERVMQDDPEEYWRSGVEALCALVRRMSIIGSETSDDRKDFAHRSKAKASGVPGHELVCQAALSVLGRRDESMRVHDPNSLDLRSAELSGSNLSHCDLSKMDLSEAKFGGADLSGAKLRQSKLRRANLSWAKLRMADLSGAKLSEANFSRSNLFKADLSESDLDGTDLCGVDLWRADLRRANLVRAKLRKANLSGVDLHGADLSEADFVGARGITLGQLLGASSLSKIKLDDYLKKQLDDHRCPPASAILSSIEQKAEFGAGQRVGDTLPSVPVTPDGFADHDPRTISEEDGEWLADLQLDNGNLNPNELAVETKADEITEQDDAGMESTTNESRSPGQEPVSEPNPESELPKPDPEPEPVPRAPSRKITTGVDAKGVIDNDFKPSPPAA